MEHRNLRMQEKSGIIYSSRDGYDAHYKLTVIYGYDKMNKKVYPIKNELECISYSGIEKDEKGATHSEDFTKYFVLEP